jgi:ribosome-associated protein
MDDELIRSSLAASVSFTFSRSSGAGGQNVNKVNTKAAARLALADLAGLDEQERARLAERLGARLGADGTVVVQAQDSRSQSVNRGLALERLEKLILAALRQPKKRRATRPSRAAGERRLASKKAAGRAKRERSRPDEE